MIKNLGGILNYDYKPSVQLRVAFIVFLTLLLTGCDVKLKSEISEYKGDGQIEYLESPGLLGASGCSIKMPSFDLSQEFSKTYSLSGIPENENYVVYLVVNDPVPIEQVKEGYFRYRVTDGENVIAEVSEYLGKYRDAQGFGKHKFYYLDQSKPRSALLSLGHTENPLVISISSKNPNLNETVQAHLEIKFGGTK